MNPKKSTYEGVYYYKISGKLKWIVRIKDVEGKWKQHGTHENERLAAIAYDKYLIRNNKPPVNILKPKQ